MRVSIDFGTSTTVIKYREGDGMALPIMDAGRPILPSVIFRDAETGATSYGWQALGYIKNGYKGERIVEFKMGLKEPEGSEKRELAESRIEEFFREYLFKLIVQQIPRVPLNRMELYLSYPAKWTNSMAGCMEKIAKRAGFTGTLHTMTEPVAAAYNMLHDHLNRLKGTGLKPNVPLYIFLLDMGAGTSDIAIFKLWIDGKGECQTEPLFTYPNVHAPSYCGGREVDKAIVRYFVDYCKKYDVEVDEEDFDLQDIKAWKESLLSDILVRNGRVRIFQGLQTFLNEKEITNPRAMEAMHDFYIDRAVFESFTHDHWGELYGLIKEAMSEYERRFGIGAEGIDLLCLTGGHSRWYTVKDLFNGEGVFGSIGRAGEEDSLEFTKLIKKNVDGLQDGNPQESVAKGMCYAGDGFELRTLSANNIWAQLEINGVGTMSEQIVSIGELLPLTIKKTFNLGQIQVNRNQFGNGFKGHVKLFYGKKLDHSIYEICNINCGPGFWNRILPGDMYNIKVACEIEVNENNIIDFKGDITMKRDGIWSSTDTYPFEKEEKL